MIDNVLLAIFMNVSMLSVQHIHDHMLKYISVPETWRSKNYNSAFKFVECIINVFQLEIICSLCNARYHTLIDDESTDISVTKTLILYTKLRTLNDVNYKTVFARILKLSACDSRSIFQAIKKKKLVCKQQTRHAEDGHVYA